MKKTMVASMILVLLSSTAWAAKTTYVVTNNRFNYVKIKEVSVKEAQALGIAHPATINEAGLRAALASLNLSRSYVVKKEVDTQRIFNDTSIDFHAPALVRAFAEADSRDIVVFSYLIKDPIFILRNDRLNICDAWINNGELHIRFQKLYAKMTGDTDKRGNESKLISQARGLRVKLDMGPGQKLGVEDPEEIILSLDYNYVKAPEKEKPVTEGVTMTGDRVALPASETQAAPADAAAPEAEKSVKKKESRAAKEKGAQATQAAPVETPVPAKSAQERLEELGKLYKSGLINKADFEAKKKEILKEL